jgi:hypothetical protein
VRRHHGGVLEQGEALPVPVLELAPSPHFFRTRRFQPAEADASGGARRVSPGNIPFCFASAAVRSACPT